MSLSFTYFFLLQKRFHLFGSPKSTCDLHVIAIKNGGLIMKTFSFSTTVVTKKER